jgi:hypothetical protein
MVPQRTIFGTGSATNDRGRVAIRIGVTNTHINNTLMAAKAGAVYAPVAARIDREITLLCDAQLGSRVYTR